MASSTPPGCGRWLSFTKYWRRRRMRWTFSARFTTWNQVRERAHQISRQRRRTPAHARRQLERGLLVAIAPMDGGYAIVLDEIEELLRRPAPGGCRRRARRAHERRRAALRASAENGYHCGWDSKPHSLHVLAFSRNPSAARGPRKIADPSALPSPTSVRTCATRFAPNFSRRFTSASMSSASMSRCTRLGCSTFCTSMCRSSDGVSRSL